MGKIFEDNIDPEKTNVPTSESNKEQYQEVQDRSTELMDRQAKDWLDKKQQSQYGDISLASGNADSIAMNDGFGATSKMGGADQNIEGSAPAESQYDIHRNWLGEVGEGFMRGVGQTISSNGDLINVIGSAIPGVTMLEGNIFGNALNNWGEGIENDHRSFLKKKLEGQEITWASFGDKDFWSANVSEMIPLALEFLATGAASAALAEGTGMFLAKKASGNLLKKGARQTVAGASELMGGVSQGAIDVLGSGKGLAKHLLRNVEGVGELTQLGKSAAGMVGAGLSNNLMAGAMNGMQLHKQMQADNKAMIAQGKEPLYTEDEMAQAATGTVTNNMAYLPIDVLSWGITYGKVGEKAYASLTKGMLKPAAEVTKQAAGGFKQATFGVVKGLIKASGKGALEGYEETYQETFENWAALKAKAKVTGEAVPDYFDYYNSEDNLATKVLSMAVGGLMGGTMNLKSSFNKEAENSLNYMNRNEMLRSSVDASKKGSEAKEFHVHNTMLDLLNENKTELFDGVMQSMVDSGNTTPEEVIAYKETFDKIQESFEQANGLNIAGKEALMRNTIQSNFLKESIERDQLNFEEQRASIMKNFEPGPEQIKAIEKLKLDIDESIKTKSILIAQAEANRSNLISGKLATPINMEFIVSRNGKERVMMPAFMTEAGFELEQDQAGIIAGLSEEQLDAYVNKSDDEIYADAKKANARALASMNTNQRTMLDKIIGRNKPQEQEEVVDEENPIDTTEEQNDALVDSIVANSTEQTIAALDLEELVPEVPEQDLKTMKQEYDALLTQGVKDFRSRKEELISQGKTNEEATIITGEEFEKTPNGKKASELEKSIKDAEDIKKSNDDISVRNKSKLEADINSRNIDNENQYETNAIDSEEEATPKKTIKQQQEEEAAQAEIDAKAEIDSQLELDSRNAGDPGNNPNEISYDIVPNDNGFNVTDSNGDYLTDSKGKPRNFKTERLANAAIKKQKGKASLILGAAAVVGTGIGVKKIINKFKRKKSTDEETDEQKRVAKEAKNQNAKEVALAFNKAQDAVRRGIIKKTQDAYIASSNAANPTVPVSKDELDAYLNTTIAKFQYGPNVIQKQLALNRNLKQKGIKMDVIYADNLFRAVGVDAVGYAVASTIFIDDKLTDQPAIFMHEMAHINYRITKNNPETKAVIDRGYQNNKGLIDAIKENYAEAVVYQMKDSNGDFINMSLAEMLIEQGFDYADAKNMIDSIPTKDILDILGNPIEAPREFQDTINEEVFAFVMEGNLSEQYNEFFEPLKEFGRKKEVKSWFSWLKDKSVTYEQSTVDVVTALNNGKNVSKQDLLDHVMKGFEENLIKSTASTRGFFSKVLKTKQADRKEQEKITKDKLAQQKNYDALEAKKIDRQNFRDKTLAKIKKAIDANENLDDRQKEIATDYAIQELEENMMDDGAFDDYEMAKSFVFRGATRILNNFTKSLNYVKRQRFLKNPNNTQVDFDQNMLLDRDALISSMYNLAFETKGNTSAFIQAIENSEIDEIAEFNKYMNAIYPGQKAMYLSSMAYVMGNNQTISAVKSYVNSKGEYEIENALSETEKNKVESHLNFLAKRNEDFRKGDNDNNQMYELFEKSYKNVKNGTQTSQDYINIVRALSPMGTNYAGLLRDNSISLRGNNLGVKYLVDNLVKFKTAENANGSVFVYKLRPFVEAIVDSNRKYTSYSVVQNAEGNMEPSKITNNNLLSTINDMNQFLGRNGRDKMPSFKAFKERYAHITDASKRTHENPILKNIYDNFKNGASFPSVTQYIGLKHDQSGLNSLYKNSTDFTQTVEDFLMYENPKRSNTLEYQHNMGAFADSPRKFLFSAKKFAYSENFTESKNLNTAGKRQLENAFKVYQELNKNEKNRDGIIETFAEFQKSFENEIEEEFKLWNQHGKDLIANKTLAIHFDAKTNKLSNNGKRKIAEYVFNQTINGLALSEIFNPGVATKDISKRNKGNSSPVVTFGNANLKLEAIPINDDAIKGKTDSGMYMTENQAKKIVAAGLGVFDLNQGLKLLNYHVERDNKSFAGKSAYFKGYTTIISEETLKTEPGLRGIYEMLTQREEKAQGKYYDTYGKSFSEDLLDGSVNYINFAVPYSAIKSDFLSPEQKENLKDLTYEALEQGYDAQKETNRNGEETSFDKFNKALDGLYYDENDNFVGLSSENFGPQQIMDKVTTESTTPVQFMSSVIVNGMTTGNLELGEQIQKLIRTDMDKNLDDILSELGDMNPEKYKAFILKNLDLENMDQSQRLIIEENLTNLDHTAISDFVTNTLANRLKQAGNKLKTNGTIAQQKPNYFYRHQNGYTVDGSSSLRGYTDRVNDDGSVGSNVMEIVLPKQMQGKVKARTYLAPGSKELVDLLAKDKSLASRYNNGNDEQKLDVIRTLALKESLYRHGKFDVQDSFGFKATDNIGTFQKDGKTIGYYVRGENVMATRIPSHGPASTGVFEAVAFLSGEGNQTIVSDEFSEVVGSDYDGDSLFIQTKGKNTPNFNEALDKTVALWTSPGMYEQIRAKMEFDSKVKDVLKGNKKQSNTAFPMSPRYNREAYNNTMISKRNIGVVFNMHRIANYLAAYNVKLNDDITINGKSITNFKDEGVGLDSRNNNSAMLANIILDNAKFHYADGLGLNDQTVNQFTLLINMGVSMQDVNDIMNSKAVQVWNKYKSNNQSPYLSKRKNAEINNLITEELGTKSIKDSTYRIDTKKMDEPQQQANIIAVMSYLEKMNSDLLKVSKIMAGHKGIENNPFILEQQLADFNQILDSTQDKPLLTFGEDFKNNPDIKAYHDNAEKILGIMKQANKIYRTSTSELVDKLNKKFGWDSGMSKTQFERVSDLLKRFTNSRILGLNNITSEEKEQMRTKLFSDLESYYNSLNSAQTINAKNNTALDQSILFQRAMNIYFDRYNPANSYVSANPRFFNESIGEDEKKAVQREFMELPQELKDGIVMYDLIKNGLTGPLSLVNIFDAQLNAEISKKAYEDRINKNNPIDKSVMNELENIIVTNEFNSMDSKIPSITTKTKFTDDEVLSVIQNEDKVLYNNIMRGKQTFFSINGKAYDFEGATEKELSKQKSAFKGMTEIDNTKRIIESRIKPYQKHAKKDMNLEVISIKDDNTGAPLKTKKSLLTDNKADYIIEANIIDSQKKKPDVIPTGKASLVMPKIDYHNYNDVNPLTRQEFDRVMGYINGVSEYQKDGLYSTYLREKEDANIMARNVNQLSLSKMSDKEIDDMYSDLSTKDLFAYSVVLTPLLLEKANRASAEQSGITKQFEDGKDMSVMSSWLSNNDIASNQPATQAVVRQLNSNYKSFVKERGVYIKAINSVTEALYQEKFNLSNNKIVRFVQRAYQSLIADRSDVYQKLYGNLVETNVIKKPNGQEAKEFKFKNKEEIEALKRSNQISDAEYNFYKTFRETTEELRQFDPSGKVRQDYIPHTAMNNFEMYSTRGLLGLMVNSKGIDAAMGDVKIYTQLTGRKELMSFSDIKNNFNALALSEGSSIARVLEFNALKATAKKLFKEGKNEDGTAVEFSHMQNATLLDMNPMSRFSSSRSMKAEEMPSMDLNKALVDYVHATLFTNGNENFKGFKAMMPLIDGVMAYNDKNGYKNAYNYTKEVIKEGFIMKKDQDLFGPTTDKIINGLVKGNTFYALGYKGLMIGKGLYAVGNIAIGKYMNVKREGGKAWLNGELRYWGTDKGFGAESLDRRARAKRILSNLGFLEIDVHDDVSVETKSGLDGIFTNLALLPMSATEDWIQKSHMLGLLTDEEFNKFDERGDYKPGETQITQERVLAMEERVKQSHGKGYTPTDQSRMQKYSLGKMFLQFSRHIPTTIRERFAKEDVDIYGNKYVGSLRQMYSTAATIFNNGMTPEKFKSYYATLQPHEKDALNSAMRGMAMVSLFAFVSEVAPDSNDKLSTQQIAGGVVNDANSQISLDAMSYKLIPPAVRSMLAGTNALLGSGGGNTKSAE